MGGVTRPPVQVRRRAVHHFCEMLVPGDRGTNGQAQVLMLCGRHSDSLRSRHRYPPALPPRLPQELAQVVSQRSHVGNVTTKPQITPFSHAGQRKPTQP